MKELQITHVRHGSGAHTHETIIAYYGSGWKYSKAEAVKLAEDGAVQFYTLEAGRRADCRVRTSTSGNKFLQTVRDGVWANDLMNLPEAVAA